MLTYSSQRRCKVILIRCPLRLEKSPFRVSIRPANGWAQPFSKRPLLQAMRVMGPTVVALTLTGVAQAQGTMDFSGAQTLMGTFKTFAIYAGAVVSAHLRRQY